MLPMKAIRRIHSISNFQRSLIENVGLFPDPGRVIHGGVIDRAAGRPGLRTRPQGDQDDDNFNPDGSRKNRDEREPRYRPELICRAFAGDTGSRPLPNIVFWESPDIWIEGSTGDPDIATPGEVNQVKVHVWNMGLADAWGTHVDLYWCNPSVGINIGVANPIGSTTLALSAGEHRVVSFDWIPEFVNNGQVCLIAQVYDPVSDPVVAPFNPKHDRHVAQRNISVLEVPAGDTFRFDFFTQNLTLKPAQTLLELQQLDSEALESVALALGQPGWQTAGGRSSRLLLPQVVHQESEPSPIAVFRETLQDIPGASQSRRTSAALRSFVAVSSEEGLRTVANQGCQESEFDQTPDDLSESERSEETWPEWDGVHAQLPLDSGQHLRIGFEATVETSARPGTADVYRIIERTAGQITGGITLVVRTR